MPPAAEDRFRGEMSILSGEMETAWYMGLDLGWGQLVSRYRTFLCGSLFPHHLQAGQGWVSKMPMKERAEPGYGLFAQASLPQLPTGSLSPCGYLQGLLGDPPR